MSKTVQELLHAKEMNEAALRRIQAESTEEELPEDKEVRLSERVWFEEDEEIMLRNGELYRIPPMTFGDTREFMQYLKTVNVGEIILNFAPGQEAKEKTLHDILGLAFQIYPEIAYRDKAGKLVVDHSFIDRNVDLRTAKRILDVMMDLNGLKK
ncbi:hypothetical protein [Paenibacillus sp. 22594]|uniref:hypothetical protein n=1 Tax=Paenibacillus sp. 22594 TaxID=3453947 RepID=UPI003F840181